MPSSMNVLIKDLILDKIIRWSMYGIGGLALISLAYLLLLYNRLPPYLPLFNQLPWGEAQIGTRIEVFLPLALALLFALINLLFARFIYHSIPLISRMLGVTAFLALLITFIFLVRMTQLVL